jgi:hypothetical protein
MNLKLTFFFDSKRRFDFFNKIQSNLSATAALETQIRGRSHKVRQKLILKKYFSF